MYSNNLDGRLFVLSPTTKSCAKDMILCQADDVRLQRLSFLVSLENAKSISLMVTY